MSYYTDRRHPPCDCCADWNVWFNDHLIGRGDVSADETPNAEIAMLAPEGGFYRPDDLDGLFKGDDVRGYVDANTVLLVLNYAANL